MVTNLAVITAQLRNPKGSLGDWLIPTNINHQLETTLQDANGAVDSLNTNLITLNQSLDHLAGITSNLNHQVQVNSNILSNISAAVVHSDEFIQGLKRFWLFRHLFKKSNTKKSTPAPIITAQPPQPRNRPRNQGSAAATAAAALAIRPRPKARARQPRRTREDERRGQAPGFRPDGVFDGLDQFIHRAALAEVLMRALRERPLDDFVVVLFPGVDDDGDGWMIAVQKSEEFKAVIAREIHVQNDDVKLHVIGQLQRDINIFGGVNLITMVFEEIRHHEPHFDLVVNKQNCARHANNQSGTRIKMQRDKMGRPRRAEFFVKGTFDRGKLFYYFSRIVLLEQKKERLREDSPASPSGR